MHGGTEDIEFLARSETRIDVMKLLHEEGELGRDELRSQLDTSRTTIQRNVEALEDRGWVQDGDRTYSLAPCGEMIAEDFLDLVDTVSIAEQLQPVLQWVDRTELDFDFGLLADADIVTANPGDPWAMVNRHVQRLRDADEVRALLPLTGLHAMEIGHDRVVKHGTRTEHIASADVVATFQNDAAYREFYDGLIETDRYELYRCSEEIPYYLGIIDGTVQIGVDEAH
ncbi:helix-turn-helix transcriptional regulator [Halorussus sp. AFM4]|uniref:helix-turn-helix transcriptional regulator n=1 Tax=Halorussus sp. AFM4 TaxID=3421651 RepID=UPI003EB74D21